MSVEQPEYLVQDTNFRLQIPDVILLARLCLVCLRARACLCVRVCEMQSNTYELMNSCKRGNAVIVEEA
jgi:hypothetical protein